LLARLAEELGKLPNNLLIEGHTDAKPFANKDGYYSNWELSTDRANSARRLMEEHGIRHQQVAQVRGFADRQLRHPDDPDHPYNRRISVIVQYLAPPPSTAHGASRTRQKASPLVGSLAGRAWALPLAWSPGCLLPAFLPSDSRAERL
jgi:chemotaxis protein MotB